MVLLVEKESRNDFSGGSLPSYELETRSKNIGGGGEASENAFDEELKKFQPSKNLKFSLAKWGGDPCYNSKTDLTRYGL